MTSTYWKRKTGGKPSTVKVKLNTAEHANDMDLAAIKKNIKADQRETSDIDSYVQFYNPVTDKLVTQRQTFIAEDTRTSVCY